LFELEAYGACLEADEHFHRGGRRSTSAALELYTAALDRHSRYARAHAGLAKTLIFWGAYYDPDDAMFHSAEAHCALALETDPQSADAFAALGLLAAVRGDFAQGWERFRVAIRLAPRSSEIHYLLGRSCLAAGEYTLAAAMLERAASLSAEDFHSPVIAGKARLKSGDAAGAHADFVNALRRSELYLQAYPDSYRAARCKAQCLWHLGHHADAMALVDGMREHPDPMPYYTASFLALAGEKDAALALLPMAIEGGWRHGAFLARDPDFDAMRSESGFRQIARSVGVDA
jgi:tetratricopeptide (TPR) repeat protein